MGLGCFVPDGRFCRSGADNVPKSRIDQIFFFL